MPAPLSGTKAEPQNTDFAMSAEDSPEIKRPNSYINRNTLFLNDLSVPGFVYVCDMGGRLRWKKNVNTGSSAIPLPPSLPAGSYILRVDTKNYECLHKFIVY
jgi:hypothetical protein